MLIYDFTNFVKCFWLAHEMRLFGVCIIFETFENISTTTKKSCERQYVNSIMLFSCTRLQHFIGSRFEAKFNSYSLLNIDFGKKKERLCFNAC